MRISRRAGGPMLAVQVLHHITGEKLARMIARQWLGTAAVGTPLTREEVERFLYGCLQISGEGFLEFDWDSYPDDEVAALFTWAVGEVVRLFPDLRDARLDALATHDGAEAANLAVAEQ